ncbi:MAG: cytochrome P450 [Anaerolineaceae bacterium]|nr:cytochrome P450 [Anaerolineaceae bacterium]
MSLTQFPVTSLTEGGAFRVVPGPKPGWVGGNLPEFNRDPLGFLTRCAREYGDLVELRFAGFPVYVLSHPRLIEEVLVTKNRSFHKGRGLVRTRELLGNGLLTSEGEFWRRQRRLAQPAFRHERISHYGEIMQRRTVNMLDRWSDGQLLDAHEAMMDLTMEIVAEALFSADVSGDAKAISSAMTVVLENFSRRNQQYLLPVWLPTPARRRFFRAVDQLDRVVYGFIQARRAGKAGAGGGDLLDMLLEARDENGAGMTDQQLRDEVMTLFLAGHETTANTLSWTWMLLAQNPEVEARLHAELDRVLAGHIPTVTDLPNLPYTEHVITESMRLYPPAWVIGRQVIEDVDIGGVKLPIGAGVLMSQWAMQRDPSIFPDADSFLPERWEGDFARSIPAFAYFPFGGGPRLCIGRPFALQEAALVLALVAQRYRLELVTGQEIRPRPSITLRPGGGVRVKVWLR